MNPKTLVKWSNRIGIFAIIALIYWVFVFIIIQVFGLRIFRHNLSEIFIFSVLGILAVMAGCLMLNIMLNLTQIANRESIETHEKSPKRIIIALVAVFPILAGLLFFGNYANNQKKQSLMIDAVSQISSNANQSIAQVTQHHLANLTLEQLKTITNSLKSLQSFSPAVSDVSFIVPISQEQQTTYVSFHADSIYQFTSYKDEKELDTQQPIDKGKLIRYFDKHQQAYLQSVFLENNQQPYFDAKDGRFELWYPYVVNGKVIGVYHATDYMQYGKLGS